MPAVALTDRANLFGALEFSVLTSQGGVQPIIGCVLPVSDIGVRPTERWARTPTIVLLAQNEEGWRNLCELSSAAFLDVDPSEAPHVPWDLAAKHSSGLIALTGGVDGPIDPLFATGRVAEGRQALDAMLEVFGDRLYVELQRHGLAAQAAAEPGLVAWAYEREAPLVATNDVHFAQPEMWRAHDALLWPRGRPTARRRRSLLVAPGT
jgi:DNA polymerase-3 subunit alpha